MEKIKVAVTDDRYGIYKEETAVLDKIGAELSVFNLSPETPAEEAAGILGDADALLVNLHPMTADLISRLDKCRVISRYGVGYDNVDVGAATAKGIWVARVPDYAHEDTSDHALALLMSAVRNIAFLDRRVRAGEWNLQKSRKCFRINGKTLGIIGYGSVGQTLHRKVRGFGLAKVLVCDPTEDPAFIRLEGGEKTDLETLLQESDYVSIHVPLKPETRNLLDRGAFGLMKKDAILVNTSRGPVIDENALYEALRDGKIAAAALDVFTKEPLPAGSPLRSLENIILSDHAGWYSEESIVELKTKAARNILEVFRTGKPVYPVNSLL